MSHETSRRLEGKVALITGATHNLGRAAAECFAHAGADIVIVSRDSLELAREQADAMCGQHGVRTTAVQADIGSRSDIERAVGEALHVMGRIDITLQCAAIRPHTPFLEIAYGEWEQVMRTNLGSAFVFAKATVPGMIERGWGRVIHVSGSDGWSGYPNRAHNIAAKASLHGFTKGLATDITHAGVTVNTIVPGVFATPRDPARYPDWSDERKARDIPVGRLGHPREFARACLFIADPDSQYMSGQAVHVNGGEFMF